MNAIECIMNRRSIRKFMDIPIEKAKIGIIFEAGAKAPSAGNLQNWKFFYVRRQDVKNSIADACMQQHWIAEAPVIIVIVSEPEKAAQFYGVRGERLYSIQNCAAVAQNMMLAAHAQDLASCWIGAFDEAAINRALNLGQGYRPQVVLPIGYPDEVTPEPMRLRIENLVFFDDRKGGAGRIEDVDWTLKDYNIVGRMVEKSKEGTKTLSKSGKKFYEKLKKKIDENKKSKE